MQWVSCSQFQISRLSFPTFATFIFSHFLEELLMSVSQAPYGRDQLALQIAWSSHRISLGLLARFLFVVVILGAGTMTATAASIYWDNGDIDDSKWESPDNWNSNTVPTSADLAFIVGTIAQDYTAYFDVTTGTQTVTNTFVGDDTGPVGIGTFNISGGTLNATANTDRSYNVGGRGNIGIANQTGGTINATGDVNVGFENVANSTRAGSATYDISGGELNAGTNLYLGRNVSGGGSQSPNMTTSFNISGNATVDVTGSLLLNVAGTAARIGNFNTTLSIAGSAATIDVGANFNTTGNGGTRTLRYVADAAGTSSVNVGGTVTVTSTALQIDLSALASNFVSDLVLIDNSLIDAINGTFSTLTGLNGTNVAGNVFSYGSNSFTLSYTYDAATGIDGIGNDLALVNLVPEPSSLAMLIWGAVLLVCTRRGKRC